MNELENLEQEKRWLTKRLDEINQNISIEQCKSILEKLEDNKYYELSSYCKTFYFKYVKDFDYFKNTTLYLHDVLEEYLTRMYYTTSFHNTLLIDKSDLINSDITEISKVSFEQEVNKSIKKLSNMLENNKNV